MARYKAIPGFRTTPLSPEELAKFNILKKLSGKELLRRLPAWARTKAIPSRAEFVSGLPAKYPAWTGKQAMAPAELSFPDPYKEWTASTYIAEFNRLNSLKTNPVGKGQLYVGFYHGKGEVFRAPRTSTNASHGNKFNYVIGPFRTLGAAQIMADAHGPQIVTVADAERFAREQGLTLKQRFQKDFPGRDYEKFLHKHDQE